MTTQLQMTIEQKQCGIKYRNKIPMASNTKLSLDEHAERFYTVYELTC